MGSIGFLSRKKTFTFHTDKGYKMLIKYLKTMPKNTEEDSTEIILDKELHKFTVFIPCKSL